MSIRGGLIAHMKPREITIEAVVTRADGTVERYGAVAYYHRNPLRRAAANLLIKLKRRFVR